MAVVAFAVPTEIAAAMFHNGGCYRDTSCRHVTGSGATDEVDMEPSPLPWPSISRRGMQISRGCYRGGHHAAGRRRCCPRVVDEVDAGRRQRAWANAYELSQDLRDKQREVLARRYGGSATAGRAAAVIQHAYRRHCMARNFAKLRLEADERWRRGHRPLSDFSRSQTVWSDMTATVDALEELRQTATTTGLEDAPTDGLTCISEYDVMSHSYSADNMLQHCSTLTRNYHRVTASSVPAAHDPSEDVDHELDAAAGQLRYISSGDSSDGGSARASPLTGVDPTSADFETVLEANVDSDDSFSSTADDDDDEDGDVPNTSAMSSSVLRRPESPVVEVPVCGATVRLRRKKQAIVDGAAMEDADRPWQRKSAEMDFDDEAHHRQLNEALEGGAVMDSLECLAMMATERTALDSTLSSLSRFAAESLSPSSVRDTTTSPSQQPRHPGSDKLRKRTYRIGLNLFNKKPETGVRYLVAGQFVDDRPSSVARFLLTRKGLSKQMIGDYLGNLQRPFNMEVLSCFADQVDLSGLPIDVALRKYQSYFRMPGEAQKIERLMEAFASRYCRCNADEVSRFESTDTVFLIAFAVIMLNTDLHNVNIKPERKMKLSDFIRNLRGIDGGNDVDAELLTGIYERVRDCEFKPGSDHVSQVVRIEQMIVGKKPQLAVPCRRLVCYCRLCEVADITKKENLDRHQREMFLFNDILLITKIINKKKSAAYSFRQSFPLCGMTVYLFDTPHYRHGIRLATSIDAKILITLNARSENDRTKFVEDLKEAILEMNEMEALRIDEELRKQKVPQNPVNVNRYSKDSGVVDIELLKLGDGSSGHRLSAPECERLKKTTLSNSLIDISEGSRRASGGSLDSGMASAESGSTHSCCQHDGVAAAAAAAGKLPHYLKTLQPSTACTAGRPTAQPAKLSPSVEHSYHH